MEKGDKLGVVDNSVMGQTGARLRGGRGTSGGDRRRGGGCREGGCIVFPEDADDRDAWGSRV